MMHKASQLFEDDLFDGDENAIVDFKYSPNPASPGGSITTKAPSSPTRTRSTSAPTPTAEALRSQLQELHLLHRPHRQRELRFPRPRPRRTRALGRHHRRRAIPRRQNAVALGLRPCNSPSSSKAPKAPASCTTSSAGCTAALDDIAAEPEIQALSSRSTSATWSPSTSSIARAHEDDGVSSSTSAATTSRATTSSSLTTCSRPRSTR